MTLGKVYLLPMLLHEEGFDSMPSDVLTWIQQCDAFFVENEKTARRYFFPHPFICMSRFSNEKVRNRKN